MNNKKAWLVAVNMGYGHQRTAYPLRKFGFDEKIINANDYEGIPATDRKIWESTRSFYEFISKFKKIPLIGEIVFLLYDSFQKIPSFYPHRDLSKPTFSLKRIFETIKTGWGKDLIERLKIKLPLITTFFTPAFMAEVFNYPGDIFCIICDADISRAWVSLNPRESRIKYFAPNSWVQNRLKLYGVKEKNIFLTGYPLPVENIGTKKGEILKEDLAFRLLNLDPLGKFYGNYKPLIDNAIGGLPEKSDHPLTIMFSIGGAGAQKEIVVEYLKSLKERIIEREIKIILSAGIKEKIKEYFLAKLKEFNLESSPNIEIIFEKEIENYFKIFNQKLRKTDILWTKPSELSFYAGLGVPILIAPSIGSQEDFNRKWLLSIGAGISEENPKYVHQWLFDYLKSGRFAEAAMHGFIEIEKMGAYNIEKICFGDL